MAKHSKKDDEKSRVHALAGELIKTQLDGRKNASALPRAAPRRAMLIINSKSGREGDSLLKLRSLVDILAALGIAVDVRVKLKKAVARTDARRAAKDGYGLVIAAGGDGTVAAVARGLVGTRAVLGIVPLGTYNNTATSLGIPLDLREACALIAVGIERTIDVGEVQATGKRKRAMFLEAAAVGLAASLTSAGQHLEKGRWEEARQALPSSLTMEPTLARVDLDDNRPLETRTLLIVVANGPRTAAGLDVAPTARMDDGVLDVQVYPDMDQVDLATRFAASGGKAESLSEAASTAHARQVRVETAVPLPVLADSKVVGTTPATFRVRTGALRVITGNGPGLSCPADETTMVAVRALASYVTASADDGTGSSAPNARELAVDAISETVTSLARRLSGR
jgi:YegS/Rv2252/BmrU family lipid kinase